MTLLETYERLKRGELYLGMYDPNGFLRYNFIVEDLLRKYRENLIEDIRKEIEKTKHLVGTTNEAEFYK